MASQRYSVPKGTELRIEVKEKQSVNLALLGGSAEIFGTELFVGHPVRLNGQKVAVFSWQGCDLELSCLTGDLQAALDTVYQADETPMASYVNTHGLLEQRRRAAKAAGTRGPRTFVVGPTDVGKSSMAKLLLSYATRMQWQPTMVDLDIGQGGITAPGSIAATPVEAPVDIEDGLPLEEEWWKDSKTAAWSSAKSWENRQLSTRLQGLPVLASVWGLPRWVPGVWLRLPDGQLTINLIDQVPLVFYFGHPSPGEYPEHYRALVQQLAQLLDRREALNAQVAASGMVINSMGWIEDLGFELLLHAIQALSIDIILVLGAERLFFQLQNIFGSDLSKTLVKLQKSGGVVPRSQAIRKAARMQRVREYFYGVRGDLQPQAQTVRFEELSIFRVGGGPKAPSTALPIGMQAVSEPLKVTQIQPSGELLHSLLGLSHAKAPDQLLSANTAGFIYVSDVNPVTRTISFLAPCPGPLPCKYLLSGSLRVIL